LASNSLLEGLVFGARAAHAMVDPPRAAPMKADRIATGQWPIGAGADREVVRASSPLSLASDTVRDLMWRHAGLFRTREGLTAAVEMLDRASTAASPSTTQEWRHRNLVIVARLIARAALRREESRGGHFRADFPERDDARWKIHVVDVGGAA
jgi:L-aspartate oxidase